MEIYKNWDEYYLSEQDYYLDYKNAADEDYYKNIATDINLRGKTGISAYYVEHSDGELCEIIIEESIDELEEYVNIKYGDSKNMLKAARKTAGLTQAELAEKSGIKLSMIQFYEQGFKDLNKAAFETGLKLAEALNCDPRDLIKK